MSLIEREIALSALAPPVAGGDGAIAADFAFGPGFTGFSGHFPGNPVCPAIVQVMAAVWALGTGRGHRAQMLGLENAKFTRPVGPGEKIGIRLNPAGEGAFGVSIDSEGGPVARFRLSVRFMENA